MRLSLRYRLLLPLTLLLAGDLAATAWAARAAARDAERRLAGQLWRVARTLAEQPGGFPLTDRVLRQMKGFSGAEFLLVGKGGVLETTFPDRTPQPPDVSPTLPADDAREPDLGPPVTVGDQEFRCLRLTLRRPHPNAGDDLYIFYPEALRRSAVRDAVRPLLVLGGAGGVVAAGLAVLAGSRLVRRVRDLEQRTRRIAAGDFRPLPSPPPWPDDEVADLYRSVNDLAGRLAAFQAEQRQSERLRVLGQFSGGLAHQLRNAATGAKLAVELFLAENPAADPEPLRVALRQLARIEANLRQFLALGRPPAADRRACDLARLLDQAVSLLRPQAQHAGTALDRAAGGEAVVAGDAAQLGHLFGNVIGNAVEAAGPGGTVTVTGPTAAAGGYVVEVADTGPGPPPGIADTLFDPFVTGKDQGVGLGLAVARQAAEAHGGRVSWARRDGRTVFRIDLPRAEPAGP